MQFTFDCSAEFKEQYLRAMPPLQCAVQGAFRDFRNRLASLGLQALGHYDRWETLKKPAKQLGQSSVLELDVTQEHRMLALHGASRFTFVALGAKKDQRRWDRLEDNLGKRWLKSQVASTSQLPEDFEVPSPSTAATPASDALPQCFSEESQEWMFYLDDEQSAVLRSLQSEVEDHLLSDLQRPMLKSILGGPGTGKTVILLKLLQWAMHEGFSVAMHCSDAIRTSLSAALSATIPSDPGTLKRRLDLLLIDDPDAIGSVRNMMDPGDGPPPRCIVCAFDPLQLDDLPSENEMESLDKLAGGGSTSLRTCYRQRAVIAKHVIKVTEAIARSSPFSADTKMNSFREYYGRVLKHYNEMDTVYPQGEYCVLPSTGAEQRLEARLGRLFSNPRNWKHRPCILCAYDDDFGLDRFPRLPGVPRRLDQSRVTTIAVKDAKSVRGVEFQHAILCLGETTFEEVTAGFSGSGQRRFHWRRGLRILLSRPRDSLIIVTFPLPPLPPLPRLKAMR